MEITYNLDNKNITGFSLEKNGNDSKGNDNYTLTIYIRHESSHHLLKISGKEATEKVLELMEKFELLEKVSHYPIYKQKT